MRPVAVWCRPRDTLCALVACLLVGLAFVSSLKHGDLARDETGATIYSYNTAARSMGLRSVTHAALSSLTVAVATTTTPPTSIHGHDGSPRGSLIQAPGLGLVGRG